MEKIKIVSFSQPLFRGDKEPSRKGSLASNVYRTAPIKYFTLNGEEVKRAYTKYGMPYLKEWHPVESLNLIDILDIRTRRELAKLIGSESLDIAFPVNGNKVSRVSEEHTKIHDDIVLKAICSLNPKIDGYYMKNLTKKNVNNYGNEINKYVFHSEVGLCPRAFSKLQLFSSILANAPRVERTRNNNKKNKPRRNITAKKLSLGNNMNMPKVSRQLSLGNNNMNTNNNQPVARTLF
jgi:hypothetical protein